MALHGLGLDIEDPGQVEAVKARGGGDGVGTHLLEIQPVTNGQLGEHSILGDAV